MKDPTSIHPPQPRHRLAYPAWMSGPTPSPPSLACSASRSQSGCTAVTTRRALQCAHIEAGSCPKSQNGSGSAMADHHRALHRRQRVLVARCRVDLAPAQMIINVVVVEDAEVDPEPARHGRTTTPRHT